MQVLKIIILSRKCTKISILKHIIFVSEDDEGTPPPMLVRTHSESENITMHIEKEVSTGGHWCAKIFFFILMAALIGVIGLIIFEYRGETDGKFQLYFN